MSHPISTCLSACLLAGGIAVTLHPAAGAAQAWDAKQRGRELTRLFFNGALDSLQGALGPSVRGTLSPQHLGDYYRQLLIQLGPAGAVLEETVTTRDNQQVYTRIGKYEKSTSDVSVVWTFDADGQVAGFTVQPAPSPAPTRFMEYETKTVLRLPVDDEWVVLAGGRAMRDNRHAIAFDQRFALDLFKRKDGATHSGDGKTNEQYYCWGAKVVAPAAGTVVAAADGLWDNRPGRTNEDKPLGNYVVLDHGNNEYSFFCHLQRNSVAVKPGAAVKAGDLLGSCGNSGVSTEPHVHFHLQNKPEPMRGEGLPAQFVDYRADGTAVARGEPKRGQTIAPATAGASKPAAAGEKKRKAKASGTSKATATGSASPAGARR